MSDPPMGYRPDPHETEPMEYQRYGPPSDSESRMASWQAGPAWRPPEAPGQPPTGRADERGNRARRIGLVPVLLIALITGVLSGAASALAVMNLARPSEMGDGPPAADEPDAVEAANVRIDESSAVIAAAERVGPAVVTIATTQEGLFGGGGVGSGFIYDENGWIVTNRHVVEDAASVVVMLQDTRQFEGTVVGVDTLTDLAIVKVNATGLPAAPIGSSAELEVGQLAIAIGSPLGTIYQNSVTSGVVSGLGRQIRAGDFTGTTSEQLNNLIQTDAAINQGNSGGPLINSAGQVIGINTAVATTAQGISFAIPIDIAVPIMEQARRGEEIRRPWIGIFYRQVDEPLREAQNLPVSHGVLILAPENSDQPAVFPGSPAERAGLQEGDLIVSIDDTMIDPEHDLSMLVLRHEPGDTITLRVIRGESERDVRITLGVMPDQP